MGRGGFFAGHFLDAAPYAGTTGPIGGGPLAPPRNADRFQLGGILIHGPYSAQRYLPKLYHSGIASL